MWSGQLTREARRHGLRLTLVVQPFFKGSSGAIVWAAIAVQAPAAAESLAEIFANHAHHDLGEFDGPLTAIMAADTYFDEWMKKHSDELATCDCGTIG